MKTEITSSKVKEAEKVLKDYLKAGDESDVNKLEELTHKFYRVIFKDVAKNEVSEINRSTYLNLIAKKVFGGKPREVEIIDSNMMDESIAHFKVKTISNGAAFISYFSLIKENNIWLVVQDMIYMKSN